MITHTKPTDPIPKPTTTTVQNFIKCGYWFFDKPKLAVRYFNMFFSF